MIPNYIFESIIRKDKEHKSKYVKNILESETHRQDRRVFRALRRKGLFIDPISHLEYIINYDNQHSWDYVKNKIIEEYKEDHTTETKKFPSHELTKYVDGIYDLLHDIYKREGYDNMNMFMPIFMNFGVAYNNAFYDGINLVFGEGDGIYFNNFISPTIIGHEFAHGIQAYETDFTYHGQSGAVNEHISDVFGITFEQIYKGEDVNTSKWLIGEGLWTSRVNGVALRSMKDPGTAYNDLVIGIDPQPDHMSGYYETDEDEGGVHIFSGICNKAFYLANIVKGGRIHTNGIGHIWYNTILKRSGLMSNVTFNGFAQATVNNASTNIDKQIIHDAWEQVGIETILDNIEPKPDGTCIVSKSLKKIKDILW